MQLDWSRLPSAMLGMRTFVSSFSFVFSLIINLDAVMPMIYTTGSIPNRKYISCAARKRLVHQRSKIVLVIL